MLSVSHVFDYSLNRWLMVHQSKNCRNLWRNARKTTTSLSNSTFSQNRSSFQKWKSKKPRDINAAKKLVMFHAILLRFYKSIFNGNYVSFLKEVKVWFGKKEEFQFWLVNRQCLRCLKITKKSFWKVWSYRSNSVTR